MSIPLVPISSLTEGSAKSTDLIPGVDVTDVTQAATGTTKHYVRSDVIRFYLNIMGFSTLDDARVATTANIAGTYDNGVAGVGRTLTLSSVGAITIDSLQLSLNDRVVVKNQTTPSENGIYYVSVVGDATTNPVLTGVVDFDQSAEILNNLIVLINYGAVNANTAWRTNVTEPVTIGTDAILFVAFSLATGVISLPVSLANGGTGKALVADNGGIVYSDADSLEILAATPTAGQVLRSGASGAPSWSTATYPAAAGASGNVLQSDGTNWISAASPATSPLTTKGDLYTFTTVNARLAVGSTDGQMLQVSSGAATGLAWSTPTYPSASGAAGKILRSDGTNNIYSTATFPDLASTSGNVLTSDGTNWISAAPTATGMTGFEASLMLGGM